MLRELKANASSSFINFLLVIIASYWVTIYHDIEINNNLSFVDLMFTNKTFLISNVILGLLAILSVNNIYVVIKINGQHIPKLQTILSALSAGKTPQGVKDSFADLHEYFTISDVTEGSAIKELIVKPIKINTYLVSVRNIVFTLKFYDGTYHSYTHEETEKA